MGEVAESHCIYHFEINSIQQYVFESGRLAEMVGASDLIEDLILTKFNKTLKELEIELGPRK